MAKPDENFYGLFKQIKAAINKRHPDTSVVAWVWLVGDDEERCMLVALPNASSLCKWSVHGVDEHTDDSVWAVARDVKDTYGGDVLVATFDYDLELEELV